MSDANGKRKLVVILGPTASGKTELAIKLGQKFNGEIVSADSRTIYRGMDIGTGKPTKSQQRAVRHHLLDIAAPQTVITLVHWQKRAYRAIDDILRRGKRALLVGGTGLYISSIIDAYRVPQNKGVPRYEILLLGVHVPRIELYERINKRVRTMVRKGLEKEVRLLTKKYSWAMPSLHGIGYREWRTYFEKKRTKKETIAATQQATRNFSKRQMTWFRGMERHGHVIHWVTNQRVAERLIQNFLKM